MSEDTIKSEEKDAESKDSASGASGTRDKTVVMSDGDLSQIETSSQNAKTVRVKTVVLQKVEEDSKDGGDKGSDKSDTEARTIASIKKLKVRPKTKSQGTMTKRNLMSIIGDTASAITSIFGNNSDVNKTNFYDTLKDQASGQNDNEVNGGGITDETVLHPLKSQYMVGKQIAEGGQGSIKKAVDKLFQRIVAIKSLHDCVKNQESVRSSFVNEARITAQLEHPSIVPIYGLYSDETKGLHLAMKLVQGNDLRKHLDAVCEQYSQLTKFQIRLRERKMLRQRLDFFLHVCDALEYVHSRNIIHRDLKPENIMIGKFNETYIMDWGIAEKCTDDGIMPKQISGTPCYLPPELLNKQPIDKRSDIYLLGLILYEIVFLHKAYPQEKTPEILREVRDGNYAPMQHEFGIAVDTDLKAIIAKCLEFVPDARYQTSSQLADDIRNYLGDDAVSVCPHPIVSAIFRAFRRHSRLFFCLIILLIVMLFAVAGGALIHDINKQMEEEQFDTKMTEIYSNALQTSTYFSQTFEEFGSMAGKLAIEAAVRLQSCREASPSLKFYDYKAGRNPETAPPEYKDSSYYGHPVSFETFVYKICKDTPEGDIPRMLTAIHPMLGKFKSAVNAEHGDIGSVITNVFIGQENGLEISYPYSSDYSDSFDPRNRPWYVNCIGKAPNKPVWSKPYLGKGAIPKLLITCSVPLRGDDGKNMGVFGMDIEPEAIIKMVEHTSKSVERSVKYIISNEGLVYHDSSGVLTPTLVNGEASVKQFNHSKLFKQMWALKHGRLFGNHLREDIYFFMYIKQLDSLYVEKYDINDLKQEY